MIGGTLCLFLNESFIRVTQNTQIVFRIISMEYLLVPKSGGGTLGKTGELNFQVPYFRL